MGIIQQFEHIHQLNQAPSRESVNADAQHESHCPLILQWRHHSLQGPVGRRTHEFSSASGHSTHCWAYTPVHWDTKSQTRFTFNLYERNLAFATASWANNREVQHRSAVRQATLGMLLHRHEQSPKLHQQARVRNPGRLTHRRCTAKENVRPTKTSEPLEMTTSLKSLSLRLKCTLHRSRSSVSSRSIKAFSVDTASVVAETNVDVTVIAVKREE